MIGVAQTLHELQSKVTVKSEAETNTYRLASTSVELVIHQLHRHQRSLSSASDPTNQIVDHQASSEGRGQTR